MMMNDEEFRNSCREICYETMKAFRDNNLKKPIIRFEAQANVLEAVAQLYIAANMPSPDESNEKPCEYCDPEKPKIFKNPCGAVSHYLYINSKQKRLADVYDKTADNWIAIKYCPFCRRQL